MDKNKTCISCGNSLPATTEYFYKNKSNKDGLHPWCKTCSRKKALKRYENNRDEDNIRRKQWYEENKEYTLKRQKKTNDKNKVNNRINQSNWRRVNKDKVRIYQLKRIMHKKHEISDTEWFECLGFFNNSCAYCGISEGEAFEIHNQLLHKEHVEHNGANDITNCVPACRSCNGSKRTSELNEWYNENNPIYSKRRYNKIVKWLMSFAVHN